MSSGNSSPQRKVTSIVSSSLWQTSKKELSIENGESLKINGGDRGFAPVTFDGKSLPKGVTKGQLFLFRVPIDFDPSCLDGHQISTSHTTTLKVDKAGKYAISPIATDKAVELASSISVWGSGDKKGITVGNVFKAQYEITRAFEVPDPSMETFVPPLVAQPTGLKQRWTPFGATVPVIKVGAHNLKDSEEDEEDKCKVKKVVKELPKKNWSDDVEIKKEIKEETIVEEIKEAKVEKEKKATKKKSKKDADAEEAEDQTQSKTKKSSKKRVKDEVKDEEPTTTKKAKKQKRE